MWLFNVLIHIGLILSINNISFCLVVYVLGWYIFESFLCSRKLCSVLQNFLRKGRHRSVQFSRDYAPFEGVISGFLLFSGDPFFQANREMNTKKRTNVGVVDDEPGVLKAISCLLHSQGYEVSSFKSSEEFLRKRSSSDIDCLILDIAMPGLDGLSLQDAMRQCGDRTPVVFLSANDNITNCVRAMRGGAVNYLLKPIKNNELLNSLRLAVRAGDRIKTEEKETRQLKQLFSKLTEREEEVLSHVISGRLNKQIAADLGISEQTVKVHRMHTTEKLGIYSVAELVRASDRVGIEPAFVEVY